MIEKNYGGAANAAEWVALSQFINYDGYRAMFEAQGKNRMGLLLWMSHPCWPSFVWQTYDYYFDPSAGYFGSKKGSEPLHIQWNPLSDTVEVVNYSAGNVRGLSAHAEVLDMGGAAQVGEIRHARQQRRQRRIAHQDRVSFRSDSRAFHPADTYARRRSRVR